MKNVSISKQTLWVGRVLSGLAVLFLLFDGVMKFFMDKLPPEVLEASAALQWPIEKMPLVGAILLICGAIAVHVRVGNPLYTHTLFPIYVAVVIWVGIYLRNIRVRNILSKL